VKLGLVSQAGYYPTKEENTQHSKMRSYWTKDAKRHVTTRKSTTVSDTTKQVKEIEEPNAIRIRLNIKVQAWTDRMLAALVNGVKGNKWFSLIDKITASGTLGIGWTMVERNQGAAGVDKVSVERVARDPFRYLQEIEAEIKEGIYEPLAIRRVDIPKGDGKTRPLGIPVVKDRIVQAAIKLVIEPIFENEFIDTSYGFRPGRGCKDALRQVQENINQGYTWVLDADLQSYFDTIPWDRLMARIEEKIADRKVLQLIEQFLKADIMEECKCWTPSQGTPQGGVLSPLLSNIYLHPLDKLMKENGIRMVRYADDFVIMCKSQEEAEEAYNKVKTWVNDNGLTLHPEKTHIGNCKSPGEGFEFLGYRFENGKRTVRKKSLTKFKDKVRELTRRNNGRSMNVIIAKLNSMLRGWFGYFKHAHHWIFGSLDAWIRRRLRSILKRRKKGNGLARTLKDHLKWPNAYFAKVGLFSLATAHQKVVNALKTAEAC
jgi:RNA-directed DNA polymerase